MSENPSEKSRRVLDIYTKLLEGKILNKKELAQQYDVNERTIQRDFEDVRDFLDIKGSETGNINEMIYDRSVNGYRLEHSEQIRLKNSEILAISKILLDSRAFTKEEMSSILQRMIECCVPEENQKLVKELIRNEEYHYIELQHKTVYIDKMWEIGQAIQQCRYVEIEYQRMKDHSIIKRKIKPVAIMFSEFYFYMTGFIDDKDEVVKHFDVLNDSYPTIYRIDRIKNLKVLNEHFSIPYRNRFEEGEFRKRVQFMYGGKIQRVKFIYKGESIESVLDRLPTAKILDEADGVYTVTAEVFGKGIEMWLRSQGDNIRLL